MATFSGMVPNFRPSEAAFHFANSWPNEPLFSLDLVLAKVPIGNAAGGLCGGMAFAVRDFWQTPLKMPTGRDCPAASTALYEYLTRRLLQSWDMPMGPLRYLALMSPDPETGPLHELERALSFTLPAARVPREGRASVMVRKEWPDIRREINMGRLAALGLVKILSDNPLDLGRNHQVLAYGYELEGSNLTLQIYDPNWPDADDVTLSLDISHPDQETPIHYHSPAAQEETVYCFFRSRYQYQKPWQRVANSIT